MATITANKRTSITPNTKQYFIRCENSDQRLYILTMFDTGKRSGSHKMVGYTLYNGNCFLFKGEDFGVPAHIDSLGAWAAMQLLGFLTCKPGDTGDDYFENYTDKQLEFTRSPDCEDIGLMVYDYENKGDK